ncbi:hypothetical protein [Piscinibacter defluvii]|uniref:hypothetical protein n=1 Tax=Piscinibacter defluvii TaxID=1796922 RepID=UPI000FDD55D4|nr:hypothetical protein [Piscinibacter defluvii]
MKRALLGLLPLLAACGARAPGDALFPLEPGRRWTYEVVTAWENDVVERETRVLETLPTEALDGVPAFRRRSDGGVDYWLRSDASGIYRVASKSDLEAEPRRDREPRFVLKQPIAVGTSWRAGTTAYLLMRREEFPREIRHSHPDVPMNYTIEALGQTLEVRAGRFDGCVRVRGQASLRLFADPVAGWRDLPLVTTEWYCPGVGLAKLVREEPANSGFLTGGRLTMELVEQR